MGNELRERCCTMMPPLRVWLEGRSKKKVLLVKMGLRASAETSVSFCIRGDSTLAPS